MRQHACCLYWIDTTLFPWSTDSMSNDGVRGYLRELRLLRGSITQKALAAAAAWSERSLIDFEMGVTSDIKLRQAMLALQQLRGNPAHLYTLVIQQASYDDGVQLARAHVEGEQDAAGSVSVPMPDEDIALVRAALDPLIETVRAPAPDAQTVEVLARGLADTIVMLIRRMPAS